MNLLLKYLPDIIVVLIVIWITSYGHRRGILRMVISIVSFAVSAAAAAFISNVTYEYVYFHAVQPAVISVIETETDNILKEYDPKQHLNELFEDNLQLTEAEKADSDTASLLTNEEIRGTLNSVFTDYCLKITDSLTGVLPDEIIESADEYLSRNQLSDEDKLKILGENRTSSAELIEREIVRPVLLKTVKKIIFALSFFAVSLVFTIIAKIAGILRGITEIREADSFFGGLLGLIYSLLTNAAIALLCSIFIRFTDNSNPIINTEVISNTVIFKYVYAGTFEIIAQLLN